MKMIYSVLLVLIANPAVAQISYGGVGGVSLGSGITYGGVGGVSLDGHDPYNPYGPSTAERDRQDDDDRRRREANDADEDNTQSKQRRLEAADKYRQLGTHSTLLPASWGGSVVSDVLEVSSVSHGQVNVYHFSREGEIAVGGFPAAPTKVKSEWVHVEWALGNDNQFARCYARFAVSKQLAYGGLPVQSSICESVLPSSFSIQKSSDGKYRCFESSTSGLNLHEGYPVALEYCDSKKPFGTSTAAYAGIGSKGKSYADDLHAAPMRACLKASFNHPLQPAVVMPSENCAGLSLENATYQKVVFKVTPEKLDYARLMQAPLAKTFCTLVDKKTQLPIAQQFDESKCARN